VSSTRSRPGSDNPYEIAAAEGFRGKWVRFWFAPSDPIGLHIFRIAAGLLFLAWLLPFAGHVDSLFGMQGWFDMQAYKDAARLQAEMRRQDMGEIFKPMSWSVVYLAGTSSQRLQAIYWGSIAVLALFTLGVCTRLTAILTWVIVVSFTVSPALEYDADGYLMFFAFYLMLGYVFFGQRSRNVSLLGRILGTRASWLLGRWPATEEENRPSVAANLTLRLLQVHFALVMVTTGLHKLQMGEWWSGVAFWYPSYPPFKATVAMAREHVGDRDIYLSVLSIGAYMVLAWEIGFPFFAWRQGRVWRLLLVGGGAVAWLGTAFIYGLPLMGPAMFMGTMCYVTADEWQRVFAFLMRLPGLSRLAAPEPEAEEASTPTEKNQESATLITSGEHA
jgi:hypothetical protein